MNDASFAFGLLCVLSLVAIAAISLLAGGGQDLQALEAVAKKYQGHVEPSGFREDDEVILQLGDSAARLHFTRHRGGRRFTHLSLAFPDERLRLEMRPTGHAGYWRKLLGMYDIEIGSAAFDETFIVSGNSPTLIREYLTAAAQAAIVELANFSTILSADLHLSISGGQLRVTKHVWLNSAGELTRFIALTEIMFDGLIYSRDPGIEFVATATPPAGHDTQCQVCGEALTTGIVLCAKCHTPHHLDCWQYFGSCAVYGCGQKRYVTDKR